MSLNRRSTLRVIRASSPEALSIIIRSISVPVDLLSFGQDSRGHYVYYATDRGMEAKVLNQISKALRAISRGGEAATGSDDRDVS